MHMRFRTSDRVIEDLMKIGIEFGPFPNQAIFVGNLTVFACIRIRTYIWTFIIYNTEVN